jgi:hypothetical protein
MDATLFQISAALVMVAVSAALVTWFRGYLATASDIRMTRMMLRLGIRPGTAAVGDLQTVSLMKDAKARCRRCPSEALCERWLAGKAGGKNAFCPNVPVFRMLAESAEPTG